MTASSTDLSFEQWKSTLQTNPASAAPFVLNRNAFSFSFPRKECIDLLALCIEARDTRNVSATPLDPVVNLHQDPDYMLEFYCPDRTLNQRTFRLELLTDSNVYASIAPLMTDHDRIIFPLGGSFAKQHYPTLIKHVLAVPYFLWVKLPQESEESLVLSSTVVLTRQTLDEATEAQWRQQIAGVNQGEKEVRLLLCVCE